MITWILILTLYTDGYYSGGGSVTTVAGFKSQQECLAAGNAWIKQAGAKGTGQSWVSARALCVRQTQDGPNG